jgi:hypothetical protein
VRGHIMTLRSVQAMAGLVPRGPALVSRCHYDRGFPYVEAD